MTSTSHNASYASTRAIPYAWREDRSSGCGIPRLNFDIPEALLAEVDFKWLMSGQGHRVDPKRFYVDEAYTMDMLQAGLRSDSPAVRACAASLLEKIEIASTADRPQAND